MVANDGLQYSAARPGASGGQQQVQQEKTDGRQRVGLMPSDGQDAYKRSSMRASKRSRADRLSYLVATGHINREEAQGLCLPLDKTDSIKNNNNNQAYSHHQLPANNGIIMTTPMMIRTNNSTPPAVSGDQALLDYVSSASITPDNFKTNSQKIKKNLKVRMPTDNRGQFRRSRTEVTLPMKTSPAFEYILKDKGRRNRRCYLWLVYFILMTIVLTIIVFCCLQLVTRFQNHQL